MQRSESSSCHPFSAETTPFIEARHGCINKKSKCIGEGGAESIERGARSVTGDSAVHEIKSETAFSGQGDTRAKQRAKHKFETHSKTWWSGQGET